MLGIRQELYEEFREHILDTDLDLYFRVDTRLVEKKMKK